MKKILYSFAVLLLFICFSDAFGQRETKPVGNITLEISSRNESLSKSFYDVPVNEKLPLLRGGGFRIETTHTNKIRQVDSVAVADKTDAGQAILKVTLMIFDGKKTTKFIEKKIKISKGESKKFRLKYKNYGYEMTAVYKT